jgi:Bacterial cadherin-like domain/Bacterial Ig domain
MRFLPVPARVVLLSALLLSLLFAGGAAADDVTLSGVIAFNSLDGSADDHDGVANGVFTVNDGNLVIDGTIQCNDDLPLSGSGSACPIRLSVSGDLVLNPGAAVVAENRRGSGSGGKIELAVGGDLVLHGPSGALPGSLISSSRISGSGGSAGAILATVGGAVDVEAGSTVAANNPSGPSGTVQVDAGGGIQVAGLILSGPNRTLLASRWNGIVLDKGSAGQTGGKILLRSTAPDEPAIRIESSGVLASQGESSGSQLILLEACGIDVRGLVAVVSKDDGTGRVALRSGKGVVVDGRDLAGLSGSRLGRVRSDSTKRGAAGFLVDLFAEGNVQVLGPSAGSTSLFAVTANPGDQLQRSGGTITGISLSGSLTARGNAFEAGRSLSGNKGGKIDLRSAGDVDLDGAYLRAVGDTVTTASGRRGGKISVRSYQGEIRWTFGTGDVRPTGSSVPVASRGTISLTACSGIDVTGMSFPVLGSPVAPFPVETDGVCAPAAPTLPAGEPPLTVCGHPPVADNQSVTTDEDVPVTITLTGSDPDGDSLTFSILSGPSHGSLGPLNPLSPTSAEVAYTPDLNYSGSDSFTFQVDDGNGGTATGVVSITVQAVDDPPVAVDDTATVAEDSGASLIDVLANDTDVDGGSKSIASATQPANGTVAIAGDGLSLTYKPNAGYCNTPPATTLETFTYMLSPAGSTPTATVTVTVDCVDDAPTAVADSATVPEDAPASPIDVLANDTDPDGGPKSIASVTQPANGEVAIAEDGLSVTYRPNANYCNTPPGTALEMFTYTLSPAGATPTATVTVAVTCVDDAPAAVADAATVPEDASATTIDVLANDTDLDGGPESVASVTQPTNGMVAIAGDGLSLTYKPSPNYCNNPPGTLDTFTYTLSPTGATPTATVSVSVTCVNDAPLLADATLDYTVLGNTQLRVGEATPGSSLLHIRDNQDVLEKSSPSDVDGPGPITVVPFSGNTGKGDLVLNSDGTFTYEPNAGFEGTDVINFQVTDNGSPAAISNGTITITVSQVVWYVHDVTGDENPEAGDTGRSTNAFEVLSDAAAAATDNDYIFVFAGNSATNPHGGIRLDNTGVKLVGEGVGLTVPGFGDLIPAGSRPYIANTADIPAQEDNGVVVDSTAASLNGIEIKGLNILGRDNGIEVNATGANSVGVTISHNTVSSDGTTGLEGIDVNANSTGTVTANVTSNNLSGRGNAFDARTAAAGALRIDFSDNANILSNASGVVIDGSGGGITTITGFSNNSVSPSTAGSGISIANATFDLVTGNSLVVGAPGDGVGGAGVVMTGVQGNLSFMDLDIFADGGAGLRVSGTGGGMTFAVSPNVSMIEATGGPAVDVTSVALTLPLTSLKSTNSPTTGVALNSITGTFSAGAGSSISNITSAAGTAFQVGSSNATITYNGTISTTTGKGVDLTSNTGSTISFTGTLTLSTGTNTAFNATGGGTVTASDTASTLTTMTGTALNVANTTIGTVGLAFRSISVNGAASGIVLNTTGSSGGLTVTGVGTTAGSGGTIQNTTSRGASFISAANITLKNMNFTNAATTNGGPCSSLTTGNNSGCNAPIHLDGVTNVLLDRIAINGSAQQGLNGRNITGFTLSNSTITGVGNEADENGVNFFNMLGASAITGTTITGSFDDNLNIQNAVNPASGSTVVTITGGQFNTSIQGSGIVLGARGTSPAATMTANISGCTIDNNFSGGIPATSADSATLNLKVSGCSITNNNDGIEVSTTQGGNATFDIFNNTISGNDFLAVNIFQGNPSTGILQGKIRDNPNISIANGRTTDAFSINKTGNGTLIASITNNTISYAGTQRAVLVQAGDGNGVLETTVTGNAIDVQLDGAGNAVAGLLAQASTTTNTPSMCVDIGGAGTLKNTFTHSLGGSMAGGDIRVRQRNTGTVRLPGYAGVATDTAAVVTYLSGRNTVVSTPTATADSTGFDGGGACAQPVVP